MDKLKYLVFIFYLLALASASIVFAQDDKLKENSYSIDLEKIVVTPSRVERGYRYSTQNVSIVSEEDIKANSITEITEVLELLPSVDILEYGSNGSSKSVHTRGASSSQVLTLLDGRPVNTPRDGVTDFNRISLSNIERVEVLRGPASSIYGANAIGGVINIITKKGNKGEKAEVVSKFGSFNTKFNSLSYGDKIKDFDYFLSYDYLASHGHRDNSDCLSNNANSNFGYQFDDESRISVSSGYYNSEVGNIGAVTSEDLDDKQETFSNYLDVTYKGKLFEGQDLLVKTFCNSDRLEFTETFEPVSRDTNHTKVYGADFQISQKFLEDYRTAFGFSFRENRLNSSISSKRAYDLKGFYFESEIDVFDMGTLKFGNRWDDYSNFGDRNSPSVSFNFWLFNAIKAHALAAKSFRAPTFNDLYWPREDWGVWGGVEGNTMLGPEKAESLEFGCSGYLFNKLKMDATFFRTNIRDMIEWTVDNSWWWRPENLNSASIKGVEFETEIALAHWLKTNFNYTYLEAEDRNTKKWLIYRPRHLYKLNFIYSPVSKLEIGLSLLYKTKRYVNADNTALLSHYAVGNISLDYKLRENTQLMFEIKNITDRAYEEQKNYPVPGRAYYGGIRMKF
ncbi:MAG: TonB-dependent receptor [Candidatus Omnitrophota bacterium]